MPANTAAPRPVATALCMLALLGVSAFTVRAAEGDLAWARRFGDPASSVRGIDLATNATDYVYILGTFQGTVELDPSPTVVSLPYGDAPQH